MKIQRWTSMAVILGVIVLSAGMTASPARADHGSLRGEVGIYYDELSPYGDWVDDSQYGAAWCPRHVGSDWRPYSDGRWVDSDYGWTWASDEPFGWATYHYGRWAFDSRYGWIWVPGTVWAPAWVSWQYGGGYVGWAPLPPTVGFDLNVGIRLGGLSLSTVIQPRDYLFVSERGFLEPRVGRYAVPRTRNQDLWRRARNVTSYTVVNNRVINRGIAINSIERATGRRVPRFRVAEVNSRGSAGVSRDQLRVFRPPSAQLRSIDVAVRNDAGVRPGIGRDQRNDQRADDRGRRPDVKPVPRGQERRDQVGIGTKPAPPGQERRNQIEPRPNSRPNNRPVTKPAERPNARPPVVQNQPHRPEPPQVNKPRPQGNPRPEANRPQPRQNERPNARPQQPPRQNDRPNARPTQPRGERPAAKPNRPHGGGGGGGNAKPKQHGHGG
ncbi:MAG: DUF6600 domain-containing protein [Acidobacteriota bacterium]